MSLTGTQPERYRRNTALAGFGVGGQRRLLDARVLVVGAGGLGSAALPYLVGAGVGHITIYDGDVVETANLQRQVLHREIGRNKAESAAERLADLNPDVTIVPVPRRLTEADAVPMLAVHDVVLDCVDDFSTKLMLSDAAKSAGVPLVWASAVGMQGQCSVFGLEDMHGDRLYLRDLHPVAPSYEPRAADIGVLGPVVAQIGAMQATEAIKILTGVGEPLVGHVRVVDARRNRYDLLPLRKAR